MKNLFARRGMPGRASQIKAWVFQHLALTEADLVTVAELACHERGCPPVETVVTVHELEGQQRSCIYTGRWRRSTKPPSSPL